MSEPIFEIKVYHSEDENGDAGFEGAYRNNENNLVSLTIVYDNPITAVLALLMDLTEER